MRIVTLIFLMGLVGECIGQSKELYIKMYSRNGDIEKDSLYKETSKYVELNTSSITYKDGRKEYMAEREINSISPSNLTQSKKIWVANKQDGKPMKFQDGPAFLNFMDQCGYDMVSQTPRKYGANYTFKKR